MTKPILISGAGLGGLLLARSLNKHGIPFKIFERDAHVAVRGQGYRIRISSQGINALKSVLTTTEYERLLKGTAQTGGGGIHNIDAITCEEEKNPEPTENGKPKQDVDPKKGPGLGGDVLGVSRGFLREELLRGFEDKINWNKNVRGYKLTADGVAATFSDGSSEEGSMLIAADGLHSSITRQLTNGKVRSYDTGARMIHGQTPARVFKDVGEGVFFISDHKSHHGFIGMITNVRPGVLEEPDTELGWVFTGSPGSFDAPNGDFSITGKVAADLSRDLTVNWHPKLREILLQQNDDEAAFLKMSTAHPDGIPEWQNEPRITLLGDSVHCMTPAGGVGANSALQDAELLGRLIGDAGGFKTGITEAYEKEMRVYASENVKMSFEQASQRFRITELK